MFPGMMDPEMIRLAQEQMSRMSPAELSKIQQQMMSNPELMKMASDSIKYVKPEDLRHAAEQLRSTQPAEIAEIGEKMETGTPEDAQINYQLSAAQMLKQKGNELHSQGRFKDALENYLKAKNNLKDIPASKGESLLLACSLNLMSCYLKTSQYDECIKEGIEVLTTDPSNVKALYRRGQAYKNIGQLEDAVSDLTKALEFSPDDDTIADVLRDAKEKLTKIGQKDAQRGLRIEEIGDEVPTSSSTTNETSGTSVLPTNTEYLQALKKDDKESISSFQNFMSQADPETLASSGGGKAERVSPDMVKTASDAISNMPPEELKSMLEMAASSDASLSTSGHHGSGMLNVTPDMLKTAGDMMNQMPPEDLQKMFQMASTFSGQDPASTEAALQSDGFRLDTNSEAQKIEENSTFNEDIGESSTYRNAPQPSFPPSSFDMQEQVRNQMKNPAIREMMSSMMKSMSPDMMANLSEQFGYKISQEDAEKAQQAMSSLSPENLDRMMKWADRIQRGVEGATNTKKWLLGRQGRLLGMALFVLLLAIFLHWLLK